MNKKQILATMSLAALAACSNDELVVKEQGAEQTSPVQFVLLNNDEDATRVVQNADYSLTWKGSHGDKFSLYHGSTTSPYLTGYQNAIYKADMEGGVATLSTPSMILPDQAIMTWPADLLFRIKSSDSLSVVIPTELTDVANTIPYVSDRIGVGDHDSAKFPYKNTSGYQKNYPITMRAMASQLTLNADYNQTDNKIAALYDGGADGLVGDEAVEHIQVSTVDLSSKAYPFTTKIGLEFDETENNAWVYWSDGVKYRKHDNNWTAQTKYGKILNTDTILTSKVASNAQCEFLMLPHGFKDADKSLISGGVTDGVVTVNTNYGKVEVKATEAKKWYRYFTTSATAAAPTPEAGETVAAAGVTADGKKRWKGSFNVEYGLQHTINAFTNHTVTADTSLVKGEEVGVHATRYVVVDLGKLDMSDLHIKNDKQLRDVARVWKKMGLADVTVTLDGTYGVFNMSQKTIEVINSCGGGFTVKPCDNPKHGVCETVRILQATPKGDAAKNPTTVNSLSFIRKNGDAGVTVELSNNNTWVWENGKDFSNAVDKIVNKGTMLTATATTIWATDAAHNNDKFDVLFVNDGNWDVKSGTSKIQINVTNNGVVNVAKGAQYRVDGKTFVNEAYTRPKRFIGTATEKIGLVNNYGVFAVVGNGVINNYGLIEHLDKDAKTYITANQTTGANYTLPFNSISNKLGTINLPYSNKEEDNISISAELAQGFVMVTVDNAGVSKVNAGVVGTKVNYINIKGGVEEVQDIADQVDYVEINNPGTEIVWNVGTASYAGLTILSDVNIKLGTTINATTTYLGADMYLGGEFNRTSTKFNGYYGNTSANEATKIITWN